MFDQKYIRTKLAIVLIIVYILLLVFYGMWVRPVKEAISSDLAMMTQTIANGNYGTAQYYENKIEADWSRYKLLIQVNNLSSSVSRFESQLVQIKILIENANPAAMEYAGSLQSSLNDITGLFPIPEV